jgi:hypothetical protein
MAKRRQPGQAEYSPLDDAKGRFQIDSMRELVREATAAVPPVPAAGPGGRTAPSKTLEEPASKPPALEKLTQYNKFLTTPSEKLELERLSARLSGALGVSVRPSHLIRACLIQLLHAEPDIIARAERQGRLKRPSNTEAAALAEFDHAVARILSEGFRHAAPIQGREPA